MDNIFENSQIPCSDNDSTAWTLIRGKKKVVDNRMDG